MTKGVPRLGFGLEVPSLYRHVARDADIPPEEKSLKRVERKSEGRRYSPAFCASRAHDAAGYMMIRLLTINCPFVTVSTPCRVVMPGFSIQELS